jgi:predicted nucleic acid-binding protein
MPADLLDTSILVDVFRGNETAARSLEALRKAGPLAVPDVVLAELLTGCRGTREMRRVASFVKVEVGLLFHDRADAESAIELLARYRPAHGVGYLDCLIAAMALRRGAIVHTLNTKHFACIRDLAVQRPY